VWLRVECLGCCAGASVCLWCCTVGEGFDEVLGDEVSSLAVIVSKTLCSKRHQEAYGECVQREGWSSGVDASRIGKSASSIRACCTLRQYRSRVGSEDRHGEDCNQDMVLLLVGRRVDG
jgi:hypothetical protein